MPLDHTDFCWDKQPNIMFGKFYAYCSEVFSKKVWQIFHNCINILLHHIKKSVNFCQTTWKCFNPLAPSLLYIMNVWSLPKSWNSPFDSENDNWGFFVRNEKFLWWNLVKIRWHFLMTMLTRVFLVRLFLNEP